MIEYFKYKKYQLKNKKEKRVNNVKMGIFISIYAWNRLNKKEN